MASCSEIQNLPDDSFFAELDNYELQMPGGVHVPFGDNETLLHMVNKQYPLWKNKGSVTSVPSARIPKLFLHNLQMTKAVADKLKSTQKGDGAEKNLYRLFMEGSFPSQPGVLVFPNVDGSQVFDTQEAKVEIDMILVHQTKGVFVFNVKIVGGKSSISEEIKHDIGRHNSFVRMLMNYKNTALNQSIPIHTVICNFSDAKKKFTNLANLEKKTENEKEKTFVFGKEDLHYTTFGDLWVKKLDKIDDVNIDCFSTLELLVARLIALNSMEGALALIHNQMTKNVLQSVSKKEHLEAQLGNLGKNQELKKTVVELSEVENERQVVKKDGKARKAKSKFILWTRDQLSIIAKVFEHLNSSSGKGLRLLVTGCKGSGKTMLLTFIANMSQYLVKLDQTADAKKTIVFDGSFSSPILVTTLQKAFTSTDIILSSIPGADNERFLLSKAFGGSLFTKFRDDFQAQLKESCILLVDEYFHSNHKFLLESLREDQHCIFFASFKNDYNIGPDFEVIHLNTSLRSTCSIAKFADSWIKTDGLKGEYNCIPSHNFEGEIVDIRRLFKIPGQTTAKQFAVLCVETICEYAEKSRGLEIIPVIPFTDPGLSVLIRKSVREKINHFEGVNTELDTTQEGMLDRHDPASIRSTKLPSIEFFNKLDIEGAEFAVVVILISLSKSRNFDQLIGSHFFVAVTRASTKVVIVINESTIDRSDDFSISPNGNVKLSGSQDIIDKRFRKVVNSIQASEKPEVLLIGRKPLHLDFQLDETPTFDPLIDDVSVYKREQSRVLYTTDVHKQSDLRTLQEFGVTTVVVADDTTSCPWRYDFYTSTLRLLTFFNTTNGKPFELLRFLQLDESKFEELATLQNFCKQQSGNAKAKVLDPSEAQNDAPIPDGLTFRWQNWEEKGDEHSKIGQNIFAFIMYSNTCKILEKQYKMNLSNMDKEKMESVKDDRKNLARLHTKCSRSFSEQFEHPLTELEIGNQQASNPKDFVVNFNKYILPAFNEALVAMDWNACWQETYERINEIVKSLRKFFETKQEDASPQITSDSSCLNELFSLVEKEKTESKVYRLQRQPNFPFGSDTPRFNDEIKKLNSAIEEYEKNFANSNVDQLILQRQEISRQARNLAQNSLEIMAENKINFPDSSVGFATLLVIKTQVTILFYASVQFAIEALSWDPCHRECYQVLFSTLDKFEEEIGLLKTMSLKVKEESYLRECILVDLSKLKKQKTCPIAGSSKT